MKYRCDAFVVDMFGNSTFNVTIVVDAKDEKSARNKARYRARQLGNNIVTVSINSIEPFVGLEQCCICDKYGQVVFTIRERINDPFIKFDVLNDGGVIIPLRNSVWGIQSGSITEFFSRLIGLFPSEIYSGEVGENL